MKRTYQVLRTHAREILLQDWGTDAPTPPYYDFPPSRSPHPFMGLGKFVAGRIHHTRAGKSYLAAQTAWFDENPNPTCPQCETGPETFTHAILTCPARNRVWDLLLKEVSSLEPTPTYGQNPSSYKP